MELRRLEEQEHQKTRKLWEEVFSDDTRAFLDYYYFIKTKENLQIRCKVYFGMTEREEALLFAQ